MASSLYSEAKLFHFGILKVMNFPLIFYAMYSVIGGGQGSGLQFRGLIETPWITAYFVGPNVIPALFMHNLQWTVQEHIS